MPVTFCYVNELAGAAFRAERAVSPLDGTELWVGGRVRSGVTVNAALTAVWDFLRFCARTGVIEQAVVSQLSDPRWLRFAPPGFDAGECGQFRMVRARALKARTETAFPEAFTPEQATRQVFLRARAPHRGLTPTGVSQAVFAAGHRAGIDGVHAHRLRHSAATGMLRAGRAHRTAFRRCRTRPCY